jgi:hypothetical protein
LSIPAFSQHRQTDESVFNTVQVKLRCWTSPR